jgi:CHASE3 domain sensor protein
VQAEFASARFDLEIRETSQLWQPGRVKTVFLLHWKVQLAFGSAIVALFAVGVISYRAMAVSSESDLWVGHTHEVLENLKDLLFSMESVESSYRGFVLTGQESYLPSYQAGVSSTKLSEAALRSLTADNPRQQNRLPELESLAAEKFQFAEKVIALRRSHGEAAAADAVNAGQGHQTMERFQLLVRETQIRSAACTRQELSSSSGPHWGS